MWASSSRQERPVLREAQAYDSKAGKKLSSHAEEAGEDGDRRPAIFKKQSGIVEELLSPVVDSVGGGMTAADALMILNGKFSDIAVADQPAEVLKWTAKVFPKKKWAQVTSFGLSGLVITDMLKKLNLLQDASIITIDTLHLFPETYQLIEEAKDHFEILELSTFRNKHVSSRQDFENQYGSKLWKADPPLYDYVTKVEPTRRGLEQLGIVAWITGRRRSQGGEREHLQLLEIDPADGRLKINPMANWEFDEVFKAVKWGNLPYNPLVDKGYASIGDIHSTLKVEAHEGERAGRWRGQNRTECGMHVTVPHESLQALALRADRVRAGYQWEQGALLRAKQASVLQVTEEDLRAKVVEGGQPTVLMVYSPWCPHCRNFEPVFNGLAATLHSPRLAFARMDGYQNAIPKDLAKAFPVPDVPSLFVVSGSKVVKYAGANYEQKELEEWIKAQLPAT